MPTCLTNLLTWPRKRWLVAVGTALATFALIGLPTDVIPNPVFGRAVAVTSWSMNVLILSSILSGMLVATYIKTENTVVEETSLKIGGVGGFLAFFAVGCPVCNKIALIALGYTGAIQYFAPIQPYLAAASILLLGYALRKRLVGESQCAVNYQAERSDVNNDSK
ncbi:hypothetical protein GALL_356060 [mine drainage metagenome]|uniref:Uncharacterized protein n=1 Tax=mine drainage metagenome TaxID=410659 RepID=A0A1J5QRU3_9ZZZZ